MTYPDAAVGEFIATNFIALKLFINSRDDWPLYREHRIIWTPTIGFMDRNAAMHYRSEGYLPPTDFLAALRIGKARCLMAWTRNREATEHLEAAADAESALVPEALWWLGVARFLERRDTLGMWEAWRRIERDFPDSVWARKIYPQ